MAAENGSNADDQQQKQFAGGDHRENKYDRDVRELVDLLSKLNPLAKEFVPSSKAKNGQLSADAPVFMTSSADYYSKLFGGGFHYFKGFAPDGSPLVSNVINSYQQQQQPQQNRRVWDFRFLIVI